MCNHFRTEKSTGAACSRWPVSDWRQQVWDCGRRAAHGAGKGTSLTPDQALAALERAGNARYVSNPQVCVMELAKRRADVAGHQAPWATIVGCSDSRVPPELLFGGLGLGELFVARNAGNLVDTATMGTVEYGAEHPGRAARGRARAREVRRGRRGLRCRSPRTPSSRARSVPWSGRSCRWPRPCAASPATSSTTRCARAPGARPQTASPSPARSCRAIKEEKLKIVAARYDLDDGKVEYPVTQA